MEEEVCVQIAPRSATRAMHRPRYAQICAARCLLHLVHLRRDAPRPRHVVDQIISRPAGHEAAAAANPPGAGAGGRVDDIPTACVFDDARSQTKHPGGTSASASECGGRLRRAEMEKIWTKRIKP